MLYGIGAFWFIWILFAAAHIALAFGVWIEASAAEKSGRRLFGLSSGWWAFATLVTGMVGIGIYWLIHESTLRPTEPAGTTDGQQSGGDNPD